MKPVEHAKDKVRRGPDAHPLPQGDTEKGMTEFTDVRSAGNSSKAARKTLFSFSELLQLPIHGFDRKNIVGHECHLQHRT
jgi:hypothetical protein